MKKRLLYLAIGCSLFMITRCTFDQIPPGPIEVPEDVSFNQDIIPIFDASCSFSGCHNNGGIPPDLSPDNAWNSLANGFLDLANPNNSVLMQKINTGGSMETFASDQERAIILAWITQGALDN